MDILDRHSWLKKWKCVCEKAVKKCVAFKYESCFKHTSFIHRVSSDLCLFLKLHRKCYDECTIPASNTNDGIIYKKQAIYIKQKVLLSTKLWLFVKPKVIWVQQKTNVIINSRLHYLRYNTLVKLSGVPCEDTGYDGLHPAVAVTRFGHCVVLVPVSSSSE